MGMQSAGIWAARKSHFKQVSVAEEKKIAALAPDDLLIV